MAKVTSSKMVPKKRNRVLVKSFMRFHTVCLVLLLMALKIISPDLLSTVSKLKFSKFHWLNFSKCRFESVVFEQKRQQRETW